MKRLAGFCLALAVLCLSSFAQEAAVSSGPTSAQVIVPRLIRFAGQVKPGSGTVGVTFTLHKSQQDNAALWIETQNVKVDETGKYTVLLGATKAEGIPMELFTSGEAQWLGVRVEGQAEQPRVLLVSVPYALKAAEAETLAGHGVNEFVTSSKLAGVVQQQIQQAHFNTAASKNNALNAVVTDPATNFTDTNTTQVVAVTQKGTGYALTATAPSNTAIIGTSTATKGSTTGVLGQAASTTGVGIRGFASSTSGATVGLFGSAASISGIAIAATESAATGFTTGLQATVSSHDGIGAIIQNKAGGKILSARSGSTNAEQLYIDGAGNLVTTNGEIDATTVNAIAVLGTSTYSYGVYGASTNNDGVYGNGNVGVYGRTTASGGTGIVADGGSTTSSNGLVASGATGIAAYATVAGSTAIYADSGAGGSYGVRGYGNTAIYGDAGSNAGTTGVYGTGATGVTGTSNVGYGVYGSGTTGVYGTGPTGVNGSSNGTAPDVGVNASSSTDGGDGLNAYNTAGGDGALISGTSGYAAWFNGSVMVDGTLSKSSGSFKIDHPLDPSNKYLYHSFVESPDMMNIYNGNITTDANGDAVVALPDWFESLNRDFRYQLTVMGQFAQAIVKSQVANGQFRIKTDKPNVMVSWQVTGIRQDAWANAHRIEAEVTKPEKERGTYLHPELFGAPEEKGVLWARHPEAMRQLKEARLKAAGKTTNDQKSQPTASPAVAETAKAK